MHVDAAVVLASGAVGVVVGLTGMGGGALLTPLLVLVFRVPPLAAVSSDLVAAMVMRPVGGAVHLRRGTVNLALVRWLVAGSVPAAFAGVVVLRALGHGRGLEDQLQTILGVALLVAATAIVAKAALAKRLSGRKAARPEDRAPVRRIPTLLVGAVGGLVVGMTSVGSGSLMIVLLIALYPTMRLAELVGTDLVQAVPLVASAAFGHLLFGDVRLGLTLSIVIGGIPGTYVGARLSSRAPDNLIRPALAVVLVATGLKLVGVSTADLGWTLLGIVVSGAIVTFALVARKRLGGGHREGRSRHLAGPSGTLGRPVA